MAPDRGRYRHIPAVLLDGKDFHRLTERQRWVFVALKVNFGPSGIEVRYRQALAHQLAEQTGAPAREVSAALDALEAQGWIQTDGNLIWIVRQLEFDSLNPADKKHRKSLQRHIAGLPTMPIVARFIKEYPEWFPEDEFTPSEGLKRLCEGSTQSLATTDTDTDTDTDTEVEDANASSSDKSDPRVSEIFSHWVKATGRNPDRVKLTANRRKKIETRLKRFTATQLKQAIDGVMLSEFHRSKPEFTDLVSCFETDEKVENHIARTAGKTNGAAPSADRKEHLRAGLAMVRRQDPDFAGGIPDLYRHAYELRHGDLPLWNEVLIEAGLKPAQPERRSA